MSGELPGIALIIPAYDEETSIYEMVSESVAALEALGRDYEVIVVDDGSTDATPARIAAAVNDLERVAMVLLPANQGKGSALRAGFQHSSKDLVCLIDADLDLHPRQIGALIDSMERAGADVVIGSKRHPDSSINYPWHRKLYSTVYYGLVRLLFRLPVRDTQTGIKVFRREVLDNVFQRAVCKQYTLDLEMLAIANSLGYSIIEAPVDLSFHVRFGRIRWRDVRNIIVDTMGIFYRFYLLRYYACPLKPVNGLQPTVSIIVPARDMDPMLEECLRECRDLDYSHFDVKLLPDGPVDIDLPYDIEVIPTGPVGPAIKRNIGARASGAQVLAFIDSDAYPDSGWLRNAAPYFADEDVCGVCGPTVTPPSDSVMQQASGLTYSSSLVSGRTTYRYSHHALRDVDDYPSCNLLIKREDFEAAGGYPEEFWPGEDTILCMRLVNDMGKRIIYVPNVVVNHHRRSLFGAHMKQVYSYGKHRGYFFRKFGANSRRIQFVVPSLFLLWLVAGLAISIFVTPVLYVYLAILGIYFFLASLASIKTLDVKMNALVFLGILVTNLTYGAGFMTGLFSRGLENS